MPSTSLVLSRLGISAEEFSRIVAQAQRELLRDVRDGVVPKTAAAFSELHDYVDANCYGGFCEEATASPTFNRLSPDTIQDPQFYWDFIAAVQDTLDIWIRAGGLRTRETTMKTTRKAPRKATRKNARKVTRKPARKTARKVTRKVTRKPARKVTRKVTRKNARKVTRKVTRKNASTIPAWYRSATLEKVARKSTKDIVKWLAWNDRNGDFEDITTRHEALVSLVYTFAFLNDQEITNSEAERRASILGVRFPEPRR